MGLIIVVVALLGPCARFALADSTFSLASLTAYEVQRLCLKQCLVEGTSDGGPGLPRKLQCSQPWLDSCVCAADLASSASSWISSCANHYCSANTADISYGISLYNTYCASSLPVVTSAAQASIASQDAFSTQRLCVQECVWSGDPAGGPAVGRAIGCYNPSYNTCFCRGDLTSSATAFLSSCVNKWCSGDSADVTRAIALYTNYCLGTADVAQTSAAAGATTSPATPGSNAGSSVSIATSTASSGSPSTALSSSTSPSSPSGSSPASPGIIAGSVVGGLAGLAIISFLVVVCVRRSKLPKPLSEGQMAAMEQAAPPRHPNTALPGWQWIRGWREQVQEGQEDTFSQSGAGSVTSAPHPPDAGPG